MDELHSYFYKTLCVCVTFNMYVPLSGSKRQRTKIDEQDEKDNQFESPLKKIKSSINDDDDSNLCSCCKIEMTKNNTCHLKCGHHYCSDCFISFKRIFGTYFSCESYNCNAFSDGNNGYCLECTIHHRECKDCLRRFCNDCYELNYCSNCKQLTCTQHHNLKICTCECKSKNYLQWCAEKYQEIQLSNKCFYNWNERQKRKNLLNIILNNSYSEVITDEHKRIIELGFYEKYGRIHDPTRFEIRITYENLIIRHFGIDKFITATFDTISLIDY